jgi:hypothetical protein
MATHWQYRMSYVAHEADREAIAPLKEPGELNA